MYVKQVNHERVQLEKLHHCNPMKGSIPSALTAAQLLWGNVLVRNHYISLFAVLFSFGNCSVIIKCYWVGRGISSFDDKP